MHELSGAESATILTLRTCRDSLLRARLSRVRETQDDVQLREAERELEQSLLRLNA